jgi:hypothetical protein
VELELHNILIHVEGLLLLIGFDALYKAWLTAPEHPKECRNGLQKLTRKEKALRFFPSADIIVSLGILHTLVR